jgi:hypothetical protein
VVRQRGQSLVVLALALVALLAMVGLIIDGGNAFVQQRRAQNGIDAASEAGAVQLARRLVGLPGNDAAWDQRVLDAVNAAATANGLDTVDTPNYTDRAGTVLGPVGTGTIPANTQGVQARGNRNFTTFIAGVIGLNAFTASATATAITGYADESGVGNVLPLTFPVILSECESGGGSTRIVNPWGDAQWPTGPNNMIALPLCNDGPGNIGWIDWTPPNGGASEVAASITSPNNGSIRTPHWYYITETGGNTSLDSAMDTWEGKDILLPIYDAHADDPSTPQDESLLGTCDSTPGGSQTQLSDCPPGSIGFNGQGWYFLVTFGKFHLEHSYIQGNHQVECNDPSLASPASPAGSGNPVNNCLIGYFKEAVIASDMEVGGSTPNSSASVLAIQLIH